MSSAGAEARKALQNILIFFYYWVVKCEEVLFYFKEMGLFIVMKRDFIFNFF